MRIERLPTPNEILRSLPLSKEQSKFISNTRQTIRNILNGLDFRFLLIVGPCSIHDPLAAAEYMMRLRHLAEETRDHLFIVMRAYFEKPRTSIGWKGMLYDPWLDNSHDIASGIRLAREFLLKAASQTIPMATEFLDPASALFLGDLISWGCIGARTVSSQTHRQLASGLPMPIAFKNTPEGGVDPAIHGILNASRSHTYMGVDPEGRLSRIATAGNADGHLVLRGGENGPNYDPESLSSALQKLERAGLPQRLLVDCSHDNSLRQQDQQITVFQSVISQFLENNQCIRGVLVESHINAGNQPLTDRTKLSYGVSLTDPCLHWEATESLIRWAHSRLKQSLNYQIR